MEVVIPRVWGLALEIAAAAVLRVQRCIKPPDPKERNMAAAIPGAQGMWPLHSRWRGCVCVKPWTLRNMSAATLRAWGMCETLGLWESHLLWSLRLGVFSLGMVYQWGSRCLCHLGLAPLLSPSLHTSQPAQVWGAAAPSAVTASGSGWLSKSGADLGGWGGGLETSLPALQGGLVGAHKVSWHAKGLSPNWGGESGAEVQ